MRMVIQRVSSALVIINAQEQSSISKGLLVLLGIEQGDSIMDAQWLCRKLVNMRIFSDAEGKMNLDVLQAEGEILLVSQFTLHASTKKGNRPSFTRSPPPAEANELYLETIRLLSELMNRSCKSGVFGANMKVSLVNDGPVTILLDSRNPE
jgi:D-tyrosyl-tRNA(Tyr) deacylase